MSEQALSIPQEGEYFRLLNCASQHVLFFRADKEPYIDSHPVEEKKDDQLFSLLHGAGEHKGLYAIKNKVTGDVLFSRTHMLPNVGHIGGDGVWFDNWFKFEPRNGQQSDHFRIITPRAGVALVSQAHTEPHVWNHPADDVHPDQHFVFLFDDMKIDEFEQGLKTVSSIAGRMTFNI